MNIQLVCFQFLIIVPVCSVGAAHKKQLLLILTYKKARAFEKAYAGSQDGALSPIFEGGNPF